MSYYQEHEIEELRSKLDAAIADIPHVGNYCKLLDERGYCQLRDQICCRRVHTACPDWIWRGKE